MAGIAYPKSARGATFARFVPLVLMLVFAGCGKSDAGRNDVPAASDSTEASAGGEGSTAAPQTATRYRLRLAQPHVRHRHAGPR